MTTQSGKIIQSAEAIVGDDTACILMNLKNGKFFDNQVNLLVNNARLRVLNGHVNMYRGFMRLEVNEENGDDGMNDRNRPSITSILEEEEDGFGLNQDDDKGVVTPMSSTENHPRNHALLQEGSPSLSSVAGGPSSVDTATSYVPTAIAAGSSIAPVTSTLALNRDQLEVEMRLGAGGSVPLTEYYRTVEFTYFSTVEPVGR
ncbi:hypothetical protein BGX34_005908 [Mortierella sp. NVP85]|nr:hypothetical protein BGX34_005908 [Mortierella sp. NVP85]